MADALAPIADRLQQFIRLLSSDRDGEVVSAARAIIRTLAAAQLDIHALADAVGRSNAKTYTREEVVEIYRRGIADGRRKAEAESALMFRSVDEPSWSDIARECAARPKLLHDDREREFVDHMVRRLVHGGEPSEKQAKWLRDIYARKPQ